MIFSQAKNCVKPIPVIEQVYDVCGFSFTKYIVDSESTDYGACSFFLNERSITSRVSKITPTKTGQFVTLWKRNKEGVICPHHTNESTDLYIINCFKENLFGQFIFSKTILTQQGILGSSKKKGKLGFRVYPPWDRTENKQAQRTQSWQLDFFLEINAGISFDLNKAHKLYSL